MLLHKCESMLSKYYKNISFFSLYTKNFLRAITSIRKPLNTMNWLRKYEEATELYNDAKRQWPTNKENPPGKWILASFDEESIIVYQAYKSEIAQYACENGRFTGCPDYNQQRMTCKIVILIRFYKNN